MSEFTDNEAIKSALLNELCEVHNKYPEIEVTEKGFTFSSCCKEFNAVLTKKATEMTTEQIRVSLISTFKNSFNH